MTTKPKQIQQVFVQTFSQVYNDGKVFKHETKLSADIKPTGTVSGQYTEKNNGRFVIRRRVTKATLQKYLKN